jgi:hypothetical protein
MSIELPLLLAPIGMGTEARFRLSCVASSH